MSEPNAQALFKALDFAFGTYRGHGSNHENEAFAGTFKLEPILAGRGFQVRFLATAADGTLFHAEHSLIAPDEQGTLCLWNFNSNAPGMLCHRLEAIRQKDGLQASFVYGKLEDGASFRERVTLTINDDGSLRYAYAWGMPGGDFAERSALTLRR